MENKRGSFSSKIGFILAAAGSAVGLGNLWRFPYLAAKYGGGIFLLVYLGLAVTFGFALMVTEIAIGRKTRLSAIGAYRAMDKRFGFVGWVASLVPIIIVPYYCVIGGWVIKYMSVFVTGQTSAAVSDDFFSGFISKPVEPIVWFLIFLLLTTVVVLLGVEKGIEKASKILMPVLVVLTLGITIYTVTRPGAIDGVIYYLKPDFSKLSGTTVLAALGQLFYSMSLAMGIMITYGSYMQKQNNLESSVRQIEIFDTGIAFLAGMMIVPSVFIYSGGDEAALNKGAGLMFVTLPKVFNDMRLGSLIGTVFFILVLFAALTSSISLMETVVSIFRDKFHWSRVKATCIVALLMILMGVPVSLGYGPLDTVQILGLQLLDFFDFVSNSVLMPIVAFLTCIMIGFFSKPKAVIEEVEVNGTFKAKMFYVVIIKYLAPVCLIAILIFSVLESLGIIVV